MRKTSLSQWYWKTRQRRGAKKATIALGRKILTIIYHIIKNEQPYEETLTKEVQEQKEQRREKAMIRELERKGFQITPPQSAKVSDPLTG